MYYKTKLEVRMYCFSAFQVYYYYYFFVFFIQDYSMLWIQSRLSFIYLFILDLIVRDSPFLKFFRRAYSYHPYLPYQSTSRTISSQCCHAAFADDMKI